MTTTTFRDYQTAAARTAQPDHPARLLVSACGLAGEAGEVVELLKKHKGHAHPLDRDRVAKELGDVLWYVADIATACGLDLDIVARNNIWKLQQRYPEGFDTARSIHRAQEDT
jgi:NTP pyrophosphatase (non-canonical NTP hydrolase)